jgi:hypothetical protein
MLTFNSGGYLKKRVPATGSAPGLLRGRLWRRRRHDEHAHD